MVQLMNSGNQRSESDTSCRNNLRAKLEIEDSLEEEYGPLHKRSKFGPRFQQKWSTETSSSLIQPSQYNPLDEPSPLGLQLRKSPSLLDLIQMRLSQGGNASKLGRPQAESLEGKKVVKGALATGSNDKLKASNFPASLLKIGTWECVSRNEGDLVAKCYYAKHKLVWEVLDGGLKSKMEIQWSDIIDLKANCTESGPGTLDIVLDRQPLFFKETNPQPRKHTLWQATSDFTGGQASVHRRHFLECPPGLLSKHFEKLIKCDPRLNWLSQQPKVDLESPYFEPKGSIFDSPGGSKCLGFGQPKSENLSGLRDVQSQSGAQSSSSKSDFQDPVGKSQELSSMETLSPSSVMGGHSIEENGNNEAESRGLLGHLDQLKVPGIRPSMSMSDLVSHIGNCISEQMTSGNPLFSNDSQNKDMLDEITQYLLSDTQNASASDEQCVLSRVNSLCCLLQKDSTTVQNSQLNVEDENEVEKHIQSKAESSVDNKTIQFFPGSEENSNDSPCKSGMSRKDSFGDLLLHLPRIASLPQFLFNISEDDENRAR